jgi:3-hydroxy-9,10-secoandrosta-1,3,5(10)-triene-9,17-dione monooxygenase reductase component
MATQTALHYSAVYPEPSSFRAAMRSLPTGVTVVTSAGTHGVCAVTANAFTALSLNPTLVLVCLAAGSSSLMTIKGNRSLAINVLNSEQRRLADYFACRERPRGRAAFADVAHREEATGAPILEDVACWLDCELYSMQSAGDHVIVIGSVLALDSDPRAEPLVFHAGHYREVRDRDTDLPTASQGPATPHLKIVRAQGR